MTMTAAAAAAVTTWRGGEKTGRGVVNRTGHEPVEYARGTNQLLALPVEGSLSSFQRQKPHASRTDKFYEASSVEIGLSDSQQQGGW